MATVDDVFNLLDAVNKVTLARLEGEINNTHALVDAVNKVTLVRLESEIKDIRSRFS